MPDGQQRTFYVDIGLAKRDSVYFVILGIPSIPPEALPQAPFGEPQYEPPAFEQQEFLQGVRLVQPLPSYPSLKHELGTTAQAVPRSDDSQKSTQVSSSGRGPQRVSFEYCKQILQCIIQNLNALVRAQFCNKAVQYLHLDPNRPDVAVLCSIEIANVLSLETFIYPSNTLEYFEELDNICRSWFGFIAREGEPGENAILCLRVVDLILVGYVYSHVEDFDPSPSISNVARRRIIQLDTST